MKTHSSLFIFIFLSYSQIYCKSIVQITRKIDQMIMVKIPKGEFFFGSDDPMDYSSEKPLMTLKMKEFYMDKFEVSNQQFNQCIQKKSCSGSIISKNLNHPVNKVTWKNAQKYCKYVGGDLPSEAQWEYAAKGNLSLNFPWGNSLIHSKEKIVITDNINTPGSIPKLVSTTYTNKIDTNSQYGVAHLAGNISEWVLDDAMLDKSMQLAPRKFSKKETKSHRSKDFLFLKESIYKVVKGASYQTAFPLFQRSSFRSFYPKNKSSIELGFRCIKN